MSESPLPSPRRPYFGSSAAGGVSGPSSPRPHRTSFGFSPTVPQTSFPSVETAAATRLPPINTSVRHALLSPQISTPVDQIASAHQQLQYAFPDVSPRPSLSSPRNPHVELPPRSRRNSGAVVSISLSTRSRSRTPRGSHAGLNGSGTLTPSRTTSNLTPKNDEAVLVQMGDQFTSAVEEYDDWQPAGGMLLGDMDEDEDDSAIEDDDEEGNYNRSWTGGGSENGERPAKDIMRPGMLFGEGLEFQGETIEPAVGKGADGDGILPLRRDGSGVGQKRRPGVVEADDDEGKKRYEVVRPLGSGSYAVVYLVREKNGRKREYALKCLSKQDLTDEQIETQLFEATIHLSLPIHQNIVTLHQTLQTRKYLFLMLELCPGEDLFYWLEKSRDASPPMVNARLPEEASHHPSSSSKFSSSSIPFSSSQLFGGMSHMSMAGGSQTSSPFLAGQSPASLLFSHHNGNGFNPSSFASHTPPTPSLLSAFAANTLLSTRRLRLIASMFSQMCEAVSICHDAGVAHRDIKPENFICCDSVELEVVAEGQEDEGGFGPQAKRKVVVKLTDFGLATTEEDSGDVECGSKPYMSYECRNNLGPTYMPALADVWSLGIVLINMLFHRNPWKDPTEGDPNFDNFLNDPTGFLLSKFTGIGREVATYLAEHVLCVDVENRVTAGQFGKWIKTLPEMISGKRALLHIKTERRERRERERLHQWDETGSTAGMFVKSPIAVMAGQERKVSASALTSTAPVAVTAMSSSIATDIVSISTASSNTPTLSARPAFIQLRDEEEMPELDHDNADETSATTMDTPATMYSPDQSERGEDGVIGDAESDARSLSTNKRRKRGVRKGKAAQAALAAAAAGEEPSTKEERDALLAELAAASQSLARDLSKGPKKEDLDFNRVEDFPPLGTSPAQIAQAKKSRWKNLMRTSDSSANPELAALARRVAERDAGSGGNWSAPAKMQGHPDSKRSPFKFSGTGSTDLNQTTSAYSSFGQVSSVSATSSMSAVEDDDWRRRPVKLATHKEEESAEASEQRGRRERRKEARRDESLDRARRAAAAAAAITGSMEGMTMGAFGKGTSTGPGLHGPLYRPPVLAQTPATSVPIQSKSRPVAQPLNPSSGLSASRPTQPEHNHHRVKGFFDSKSSDRPTLVHLATAPDSFSLETVKHSRPSQQLSSVTSNATHNEAQTFQKQANMSRQSTASIDSTQTVLLNGKGESGVADGPNKPKIKGQIQSLAKMLSGLKTKGKD